MKGMRQLQPTSCSRLLRRGAAAEQLGSQRRSRPRRRRPARSASISLFGGAGSSSTEPKDSTVATDKEQPSSAAAAGVGADAAEAAEVDDWDAVEYVLEQLRPQLTRETDPVPNVGSTSCPRAASRTVARKACGRCRSVGHEALVAAERCHAPSRPSPALIRARVCELTQKSGEARAAQSFARTPLCELMDDGWDVRARVVADAPVCVHSRHAFFMSKCV